MTLEDTAKLIAKVHANATGGAKFEYDNAKGEYGNVAAYMAAHTDGRVYGVKFPKYTYSNTPTGVKTRDNANLAIEISTNDKAGRDDYAPLNAFRVWDVNATVDDDGVPHVTAIDGIDTRFKRDGSNGDVYVMTCPGYYKLDSTSTHNEFLYSDTQYDGYTPLPGVLLPDGSKRPCLLFAKYAASLDSQQRPLSVSGKEIDREFGSQNRAIDYALKKGKGYAGRCAGDNSYIQLMLMLKYATKNSDVLGGCWQYTPQTAVTKAETGVKRVIIATSSAGNFDIGSTINIGTDKERNNTGNYSAARARTILSKTNLDANNTALNLDGDAITTTTACFVSSMPWKTGATDKLLGTDGRPSAAFAANHQPIRLQGIELFNGIYETDADLIVNAVKESDDKGRLDIYRVFDITKASKTSTANYTKIGEFPARTKAIDNSWRYAEDFTLSNGVLIPTGIGATSATGLCDGVYANPLASQGLRQVRRFGILWGGAACGAFAVFLTNDLAYRGWYVGGRLSALGRTKA
nr:MAG TPA: tail collar fiber protein [Bacteriophage sp.]